MPTSVGIFIIITKSVLSFLLLLLSLCLQHFKLTPVCARYRQDY